LLGRRRGWPVEPMPPHSLPLTLLGTGILWFGWFGFNAGSALHADGLASLAFVNTHLAAAAGALTWAVAEAFRAKKATMLGVASGLVAGLVAITPAAGYVSPMVALGLGAAAGIVCYGGVLLKTRLGYDDALDAFGVHGVGGATGALATGLFASAALNNGHGGGLDLVSKQAIGIVAAGAWAAVVTFVLLKGVDLVLGLRVDAETEHDGLDGAQHGESAYGSPGGVAHSS
ncbi:MAG TPA: ammonia channel protein, partial [Kofleriaceae bacterium]|nr:ammonia channel protein [Kofleriaceae bacterium]